jgi:hypothetical protein
MAMIKDWEKFTRLHAAALDNMLAEEEDNSRKRKLWEARQKLEPSPPPTPSRKAGDDSFKARAEQCRLLGEFCDNPSHRRKYAELAERYERMGG